MPYGSLDMDKLLAAFAQFFRENSDIWLHRYANQEAGPQLLLQAFLQRVVNGGGHVRQCPQCMQVGIRSNSSSLHQPNPPAPD